MKTWVQIPSTCKMCKKSVRCGMHLNLSEDRQILGICCLATLDTQWAWYPVSKDKVERNRGRHPTDADLCSTQRVTHTQHVQMCTHTIYCKGQQTDSQAAAGLTAVCLLTIFTFQMQSWIVATETISPQSLSCAWPGLTKRIASLCSTECGNSDCMVQWLKTSLGTWV